MFRIVRQWLWGWRLRRLARQAMPTLPTRWWQVAWWRGKDSAAITAWLAACKAEQNGLTAYAVAWQVWAARGKPEAELPLLSAIWAHTRAAIDRHAAAWQALYLPEP